MHPISAQGKMRNFVGIWDESVFQGMAGNPTGSRINLDSFPVISAA